MTQITWRAPDDVVDQVRKAATREGRSLNDYLTAIARAATDPTLAGSDIERIRERLDQAGLLERPVTRRRRPAAAAVADARSRASHGTPLSDLVSETRG